MSETCKHEWKNYGHMRVYRCSICGKSAYEDLINENAALRSQNLELMARVKIKDKAINEALHAYSAMKYEPQQCMFRMADILDNAKDAALTRAKEGL